MQTTTITCDACGKQTPRNGAHSIRLSAGDNSYGYGILDICWDCWSLLAAIPIADRFRNLIAEFVAHVHDGTDT